MNPLTLGGLIDAIRYANSDADVYFDFARMVPTTLASYRGDYGQLAIGFEDGDDVKVGALRAQLNAAVGQHFEGYKGGGCMASLKTPLWVANWGRTSITQIKKATMESGDLILHTRFSEWC